MQAIQSALLDGFPPIGPLLALPAHAVVFGTGGALVPMGVTMTDSLNDKVAIVTGAGSGIGEALSRELARRGARVVVADIAEDDAKRVAGAIAGSGGRATARRVDVSLEQDMTRLVEETAAVYAASTTSSTTPASRSAATHAT